MIGPNTYQMRPQEGGQTMFLASKAYFVLYGGAAGGGKTFGLLMDPLKHHRRRGFTCVTFRRERTQITEAGSLWDASLNVYSKFGAIPNIANLKWAFSDDINSATISFAGLALELDKLKWQGAEICQLQFDELTHFSETQFRYLLSRNRSTCGVLPRVRATCNPDPDSWVRSFVEWYLLSDGLPDPRKRGKIRYFALDEDSDKFVFADSAEALNYKYGIAVKDCMTFTFIYATLEDNPKLLEKDPAYASKLKLTGAIEAQGLLNGNWNVRRTGKIFKAEDFRVFTLIPRAWDVKVLIADTAQKTKEANDFTVLQAWLLSERGIYLVDQIRGKMEYPDLELMAEAFASKHKDAAAFYIEDKVSGTSLIQSLRRKISVQVLAVQRNKDKYTRMYDSQGYIKNGYVFVNPMLDYYPEYINEMVSLNAEGEYAHDDQADCTFDAIDILLANPRHVMRKTVSSELTNLAPRFIR